jgi:hypothetical protein
LWRLVTRTLFVLGGTIAATAVGWLISSASASADTLPDLSVPGTHADSAPVSGAVTGAVSGVLGAVGMSADHVPAPSSVIGALHLPVIRDIPVTPLVPPAPVSPQLTKTGPSGPPIGLAAASPMPTVTTVASIPPGPATVVRSVAHQVTVLVPTSLPLQVPNTPQPCAPVTVPGAPGGIVGASGSGGLGMVDTSGALPVPDTDTARVIPATRPLGRVTAGKQPGITPD